MPASFIEIPIELLKFVRQSKLTSLQNNLWLYFHQLDHFGRSKYFLVNLEKIELTAEEKKAAYNLMIRLQVASYNLRGKDEPYYSVYCSEKSPRVVDLGRGHIISDRSLYNRSNWYSES